MKTIIRIVTLALALTTTGIVPALSQTPSVPDKKITAEAESS
jgi:hypothetical protein